MGYPCAHAFSPRVVPLSVNNFDQHWWLVRPPMLNDVTVVPSPVAIQTALKMVEDEYTDAPSHRKRILLDHVLAVPETGIRDPVRVQTRGRPTGSTQRLPSLFEHVDAALGAPVRLRRCRICQTIGHNLSDLSSTITTSTSRFNFTGNLPSKVGL